MVSPVNFAPVGRFPDPSPDAAKPASRAAGSGICASPALAGCLTPQHPGLLAKGETPVLLAQQVGTPTRSGNGVLNLPGSNNIRNFNRGPSRGMTSGQPTAPAGRGLSRSGQSTSGQPASGTGKVNENNAGYSSGKLGSTGAARFDLVWDLAVRAIQGRPTAVYPLPGLDMTRYELTWMREVYQGQRNDDLTPRQMEDFLALERKLDAFLQGKTATNNPQNPQPHPAQSVKAAPKQQPAAPAYPVYQGLSAAETQRAQAQGTASAHAFMAPLQAQALKESVNNITHIEQKIVQLIKLFNATQSGGKAAAPRLAALASQVQALHISLGVRVAALTAKNGQIDSFQQSFKPLEALVKQYGFSGEDIGLPGQKGLACWKDMGGLSHGISAFVQRFNQGVLLQIQAFIQQANSVVRSLDAPKAKPASGTANTTPPDSPRPEPPRPDIAPPGERLRLPGGSQSPEQVAQEQGLSVDDILRVMQEQGCTAQDAANYINGQRLAGPTGLDAPRPPSSPPDTPLASSSGVPKGTQQSRKDALVRQGNPLASGIAVYNPRTTTTSAGMGVSQSTSSDGVPTEGRLRIPVYPQGKADGRFKAALQQIQRAFPGIRLDFSRCDLSNANLSGVDLSNADLRQTNFSGATLPNSNLAGADCTEANFSDAGLAASNFTRTNLTRANLSGATLYFANLETAILKDANLVGAHRDLPENSGTPSAPTAQTSPPQLPASNPSSSPVIRLMETSEGRFEPVDSVPPLDPGQGYVVSVKSIPGEAPQIAFRPGYQATAGGDIVPNAAQTRPGPHYDLQQSVFPTSEPDPNARDGWRAITYRDDKGAERSVRAAIAAGYISLNADGTLTLTTKSGWHNKEVERIGNLNFPRNTDPRNSRLLQLDGAAAREFARLLAQATGRSVRLGDPIFEGRDAAQTIVHPEQPTAQPTSSTTRTQAAATTSTSPAQQPTPVELRQNQTLRRRRDEDLTGQNISVRVNGNDLNPAMLDVELAFPSGRTTGFTPREIAQLAGNLNGAAIHIRVIENCIQVSQSHPQLQEPNLLTIEPSQKQVSYVALKVHDKISKPLLGLALRIQQLKAAEQQGLASAELAAGRSNYYPVGYFTWPKLGFDASVPDEVFPELLEFLQSHPETTQELGLSNSALPATLMLSSILFNPDGSPNKEMQAWWKEHGVSIGLAINFGSNSPSAIRFHQQLERFGMND